jgi:hypothetical protein
MMDIGFDKVTGQILGSRLEAQSTRRAPVTMKDTIDD